MEYIVTKNEMKAIDACTIDKIGIPQSVLMERAALALSEEIERINPDKGRILIAVDGGNNGGDGLAAARILSERGYPVDIYYVGGITEVSEQFEIQKNILMQIGQKLYLIVNMLLWLMEYLALAYREMLRGVKRKRLKTLIRCKVLRLRLIYRRVWMRQQVKYWELRSEPIILLHLVLKSLECSFHKELTAVEKSFARILVFRQMRFNQ